MKSVHPITRSVSLVAFVAALVLCFGFGITQAGERRPAEPLRTASHRPVAPPPPLPGFEADDRPDLQVLLSSIDMTVSFEVILNS